MKELKTICRDCIFATWDGDRQEDCRLDRLDKLEANGATLLPEESGGKLYLTINGRFCTACRNEESMKDIPRRQWRSHVMDFIAVRCEMVIVLDENATFNDFKHSFFSIQNQSHPAKQVTVATNNAELVPKIQAFLQTSKLPWQITTVAPQIDIAGNQLEEFASYEHIVDETLRNSKQTYYSVCRAGYMYNGLYLSTINTAINVDMIRLVALRPDQDGNALFVQTELHNGLAGNKGTSIIQKLTDLADEQQTRHVIKEFSDLCVSV